MLKMNIHSQVILTNSGGLQEECTVLGTPCLTLRWNTERPITLREHGGARVLVGNNISHICNEYHIAMKKSREPIRHELCGRDVQLRDALQRLLILKGLNFQLANNASSILGI